MAKTLMLFSAVGVFVLVGSLVFMAAPQEANGDDGNVIYRVRLSEATMQDPHALAAWRINGQHKLAWRKELFFKQFPTEHEYRFSYKEELDCRMKMAEYWLELKKTYPELKNAYLDDLAIVYNSIYFPEYVYKYYRAGSWEVKKDRFRLDEYNKWAKEHLKGHKSETMVSIEEVRLSH